MTDLGYRYGSLQESVLLHRFGSTYCLYRFRSALYRLPTAVNRYVGSPSVRLDPVSTKEAFASGRLSTLTPPDFFAGFWPAHWFTESNGQLREPSENP